jgi:CBS domain-containing protein
MPPDPRTVSPSTEIGEAAAIMVDAGVRHLPVMDHGSVVGWCGLATPRAEDLEPHR